LRHFAMRGPVNHFALL